MLHRIVQEETIIPMYLVSLLQKPEIPKNRGNWMQRSGSDLSGLCHVIFLDRHTTQEAGCATSSREKNRLLSKRTYSMGLHRRQVALTGKSGKPGCMNLISRVYAQGTDGRNGRFRLAIREDVFKARRSLGASFILYRRDW